MTASISFALDRVGGAEELVDTYLSAWNEPDATRRLRLIETCWSEGGSLVDPPLDGHRHEGINALMEAMQAKYPGHAFVRTTTVDAHHDTFRVGWELRGAEGIAVLVGTDYGMVQDDGRLIRVSGFFFELAPRPDGES